MTPQELTKLGLLESEAKIYLALLELGHSSVGKIAKKTNLNRVSVYKNLNSLVQQGLASYVITKNGKLFQAVNPTKIKNLISEKEKELNELKSKLPQLSALSLSQEKAALTEVYEGIRGGKTVWENYLAELKRGDEVLVVGASQSASLLGGYFKDWNNRRAKKKVRMKIIYNQDAKELIKIRKNQPLTEVRIMPKEYITPASFEIAGNKVLIILYEPQLMITKLESQSVADSFRQYFKMLWKAAKKV